VVINLLGNSFIKKTKLIFKLIILVIIVFYILPKLLSLLWYLNPPELKIREEHLLEKPLRVILNIINYS